MDDSATDTMAVLDAVLALPEQFATALAHNPRAETPGRHDVSNVVIAGMGGSGVGADLAYALCLPRSTVPVVVVKSDQCPGFVDERTLVIVVSFSGDTAETNAVMREALRRGAKVVAVASGGRLADEARSAGAVTHVVDDGPPCPRAAVAVLSVPVLRALETHGVLDDVDGSLDEQFEATLRQLRERRDELAGENNRAVKLARRIGRTIPLIYGVGPLGAAAAQRWKSQFNENPKIPAFIGVVPEITHNEVCGWAQHGDMTRQVFTLLCLRHSHEGDRNAAAMEAVAEITDETVAGVHEIEARGDGPLAQFFDLALMGDLVSVHMALAEGVDPGPVPVLDELKARLGP